MAKQAPLPLGRADPHIKQSRGAENYIMNFYVTNYSTSFTKPSIDNNKSRHTDIPVYSGSDAFKPRSAPENPRTGYTTNVRPQIFYNRTIDQLDNPELGRVLADNYNTVTHLHYQPYRLANGLEELPAQVKDQTSSYTQHAYNHNPRPDEVYKTYIDTSIRAPYDVLPKHKALLDKINNHDPVPTENHGHGPNFMSTEYGAKFETPKKTEKLNPAVGPKETSGFVMNKESEDVLTGEPGERWQFKNRTTGTSDYHDKYVPYVYPKSATVLPNISNYESSHESTYKKAYRPSDVNPRGGSFNVPTEYKDNFLGKRFRDPKVSETNGTSNVGPKELGGQSRCEPGSVQTLDDPRRFITNYQIKHFDMTPKGKDREGFVTGGVKGIFDDGYTKNVRVHNTGSLNTLGELNNMDSFQSRSIRSKDVYYDDHTHDHKFPMKTKTVTFQDNNPYSVNMTC